MFNRKQTASFVSPLVAVEEKTYAGYAWVVGRIWHRGRTLKKETRYPQANQQKSQQKSPKTKLDNENLEIKEHLRAQSDHAALQALIAASLRFPLAEGPAIFCSCCLEVG